MASPYLYSTPIAEQTLRQGTPMSSGDGQLCETPAAQALRGCLELVCLAQGKVILAASTFRREKVRWDPCTGTSITAQSRTDSQPATAWPYLMP